MAATVLIGDLKRFYKVLKAVSGLTSEPNLKAGPARLRVAALDSANVFMFEILFTGFSESERSSDEWFSINTNYVMPALSKLSKSYDEARLSFSDEIALEAGSAVVRVPSYYAVVDAGDRVELPVLDKIETTGVVLVSAFERALSVASINQDGVRLSSTDYGLVFDASTSGLGSARDQVEGVGFVDGSSSSFSVEYLERGVLSLAKLSGADELKLELASDYPLRATAKGEYFEFRGVIAPRVEG